jgi:hypothetical protein
MYLNQQSVLALLVMTSLNIKQIIKKKSALVVIQEVHMLTQVENLYPYTMAIKLYKRRRGKDIQYRTCKYRYIRKIGGHSH